MTDSPFPSDCAARFEPQHLIGSGGFGVVWLATQRDLGRRVAIKLLHAASVNDEGQVARFQNEARITAALSHPHIVVVLDHGFDGGVPWIAYEYIAGASLRDRLRERALWWSDAFRICGQVAGALDEAHRAGILHRDIKPDNILEAATDHVKVADFGIAHWRQQTQTLTAAGIIIGSPTYLSPEQLAGATAGPAADLYALGITLFELIAGTPPFHHENPSELFDLHRSSPVPRLRDRLNVPPVVDEVLQQALAKNPADRFPDAGSFREALEAASSGGRPGDTVVSARPAPGAATTVVVSSTGGPPVPVGRKWPAWIIIAGVGLAALAMASLASRRPGQVPREQLRKLLQLDVNGYRVELRDHCESLLATYPRCARLHMWLAKASALNGDDLRASAEYIEAIRLDPDDPFISYCYFWFLWGRARHAEADAVARAAADNPRAPPYTRICRALPHWGRGKYSEAADHIEAEVSDELVRPAIEYQQARLNQMAMRMDRALHHYNRVVAAAPWFGCVHHQLAKLRLEAQDLAGAATLLERAMACFTDKAYVTDVELHIVEDLVRLLLTQGKLREAVREVEKIALREPESNRWREWQKQLAFSGWMKCAALYPRLKPNEMMDQTTCKELESLTGVVLGRKSSAWRRWVELGRWLEASVRSDRPVPLPAAFRSNNRSVFAEMEDYAYKNELGGTIERRAPGSVELLASSLVSHQNRCYDGRTWLILGLELDRAGLKKEARLLFREGLSRLPGRSLGLKLPYIYAALTVALDTTPGHDLEREWFQWLLNGEVKWFQSWSGLYFTLDKTKPELLERILVRGAADPVRSEQAYHYLGYYYAQVKGNRPGAERTWLEGIRHFPKSRALALRLIPHYLQTGKLQRAKQFLDRITDEDFYRWACDFVEGDGPRTVPPVPPGFEKDPTCRMLRIQRFLEWDDLKAAETEFQRSRGANETQPGESMCVKMLWAGSALPELDAYLKGGLNWLSMAGQPESTARNARWIQAAESLFDARGPFFRNINIWWALWLSRRGQTEEAIAVLKRYIDVGLCTPGDVPLIVEILARPHWIRMFRPETPRPAPIPILPFSATSSLADRYLRELEKGALAAAAQTAEELRDFSPDADVFTLAAACPIAAGAETAETRRQMEMFRVAARWNQSTWLLRRLAHPFGRNSTLVGTGTP